jgi:hypothetical protein
MSLSISNSDPVKLPVIEAKKLIQKALVFVFLNLGILTGLLCYFSEQDHIHLQNWETESNLLMMGEDQHYDVAILGTSRGRVFARDNNHRTVEQLLNKKVINLSKGGGGGLMPAELHLSYFFHQKNTVDHIVYLVDPWVFFAPINNENNEFFLRDEPFKLFILWKLISGGFPLKRILSYFQMITVKDWKAKSQYAAPGLTKGALKHIDTEKLEHARQHYMGTYDQKKFKKYSQMVDKINLLAKKNGARITYIMLPMLIPDFPGASEVDRKLKNAAANETHVAYHNCLSTMQEKRFYYDHMHFNKTGIVYFLQKYLNPSLYRL